MAWASRLVSARMVTVRSVMSREIASGVGAVHCGPRAPVRSRPPGGDDGLVFQHFGNAPPGAIGGTRRQVIGGEEAGGDDFAIRFRRPVLAKLPDHIDRHMVASRDMA